MSAVFSPTNANCLVTLDPAIINALETGAKALQVTEGLPFEIPFGAQVWWTDGASTAGEAEIDVPGVVLLVSAQDPGLKITSSPVLTQESGAGAMAIATFVLSGATLPSSVAMVRLQVGQYHFDMPVNVTAPTLATDAQVLAAVAAAGWRVVELNITEWACEGPDVPATPGNPFSGGRATLATAPTAVAAARAAFVATGINPLTVV